MPYMVTQILFSLTRSHLSIKRFFPIFYRNTEKHTLNSLGATPTFDITKPWYLTLYQDMCTS